MDTDHEQHAYDPKDKDDTQYGERRVFWGRRNAVHEQALQQSCKDQNYTESGPGFHVHLTFELSGRRRQDGRTPGPGTAYRQTGPGVLPLALRLSEGLGAILSSLEFK